ncbi:MAG TPA: hypothetical protein VE620_13455, partial [Myxococcales bacterium]|nr:hypothetical protein [Myxococcales bacterium]
MDLKRLVPSFELVVDGQKADLELAGAVIGIRCSDDMDRAGRFQLHLSDVDRKWTKLDKFKVGTQIEIKLGYQGQLKTVCKAEVKTLEVVLAPDGPTRLLVAGFDKGHAFSKGTVTKTYKNVKDSDLARQIAQRNRLTADIDDSQVVHDYVIQSNLSDYDFLMQRAVLAGFRFNIDDKKLSFKKPQIGQQPAAKLVWRENIGRLAVEVNTYDQVSKITTSGWASKTLKNMKSPSKKGDELGTQGGQVTGAQLVKKMFGDVESVVTVASGEQSLLDAMAKAEFNKRSASFVLAEGRITGDPAVRAGAVIEVDKAGQRLNGEYYVTGSDHLFFVDTGYATEFRARRFAIQKQTPPPKNPAKAAAQQQQAEKEAKEAAKQAEQASKFKLEAAREAQKRAQQAAESAKNVLDRANQALGQAKQGGGDVARATLAQAEKKIAEAKQYLGAAQNKVNAAATEIGSATDDMAKRALTAAHEAAANVLDVARGAAQHASDGFDAAKAAALDALHTVESEGAQFSSQVKAAKNTLLSKADACLAAGKSGIATALGSIVKAKNAIETCAAKSPDGAKSIIGGLSTDAGKLQDIAKQTGKLSQDSILAAVSAGAQHAADAAKNAVARSQEAIAKARDAAKNAPHGADAQKFLEKAAEEKKRAEAALAKAQAQLRKNDELARLLPSRPAVADARDGAVKAAQTAAAAAQSATRTAGDAAAAASAACKS